jgi:hypothetical protein
VGLTGIAEGMRRNSLQPNNREMTLNKAKSVCKEFSTKGQSAIVALTKSIMKASTHN